MKSEMFQSKVCWLFLALSLAVIGVTRQQDYFVGLGNRRMSVISEQKADLIEGYSVLESGNGGTISSDSASSAQESASRSNKAPSCNIIPVGVPHVRFYPKRFFENSTDESVKGYLPVLRSLMNESNPTLKTRFLSFLPREQASENVTLYDASINARQEGPHCQAMYYHIHKNGGTTMMQMARRQTRFRTKVFYAPQEVHMGSNTFHNKSMIAMQAIYELQQENAPSDALVFSFLRDPVSRFVSGMSQIFINHRLEDALGSCPDRSEDTEQLFHCVLDMMEDAEEDGATHINTLDPHIAPQAFALYRNVMDYDIAVELMDLSVSLNSMLGHLNVPPMVKRRASKRTTEKFRFEKTMLTKSLIRRICHVYRMDVAMLRETGLILDSECLS